MGNLTTWAREVPRLKEYEEPLATLELPAPQTADAVSYTHLTLPTIYSV